MVDRVPIIQDENQPEREVSVRIVSQPVSLQDLIPKYEFQFDGAKPDEESERMYSDFIQFLKTNEELAFKENIASMDDYICGFQRALALTKLWIDSVYI